MDTRRSRTAVSRSFTALSRNRWVLFASILLGATAGWVLSLITRSYEAYAMLSPSPEAVRCEAMEYGNLDDARFVSRDEVQRAAIDIAGEINNPGTIGRAMYVLASADGVRNELHLELPRAPVQRPVQSNPAEPPGLEYESFTGMVREAMRRADSAGNLDIEDRQIGWDLFPDMLYLNAMLDVQDVNKAFLRPGELQKTISAASRKIDITVRSDHSVMVAVRDHDPHRAEILVDSIVAEYRAEYYARIRRLMESRLREMMQRRNIATRREASYRQALAKAEKGLHTGRVATYDPAYQQWERLQREYRPVSDESFRLSQELESVERQFSRVRSGDLLQVPFWAGPPPGTANHQQMPAQEVDVARMWVFPIRGMLIGLLLSTLTIGIAGAVRRPAEPKAEPAGEAEPVAVGADTF